MHDFYLWHYVSLTPLLNEYIFIMGLSKMLMKVDLRVENKRRINCCKVNRWEDRVELFPPPLHPCSPHRHHMETTWRSSCGEAVTPQKNNTASFLRHQCCWFCRSAVNFSTLLGILTSFCRVFHEAAALAVSSPLVQPVVTERNAVGFI